MKNLNTVRNDHEYGKKNSGYQNWLIIGFACTRALHRRNQQTFNVIWGGNVAKDLLMAG